MKSEFGKGMTYCLGMFLAHEGRINSDLKLYGDMGDKDRAYEMWFYGAADHIYEFEIQETLPIFLKQRLKRFQRRVMRLRLPMNKTERATKKDFNWATQEARDLLRLIDKANGVPTEKGQWE